MMKGSLGGVPFIMVQHFLLCLKYCLAVSLLVKLVTACCYFVTLEHFWHSNPFCHFGLSDVAVKWLRKAHASARNEIYDPFFVKGPPTEVIQALVPALSEKEDSKEDHRAFCLNLERWYS
jgi:hypothetical protein